ncbi:MAG: beta-N-acetylhexosaminidase [Bacteroidota bacterium]
MISNKLNKLKISSFFALLIVTLSTAAQEHPISIIPKPVSVTSGKGQFILRPGTLIYSSKEALPEASFLVAILNQSTGYQLKIKNAGSAQKGEGISLIITKDFTDTVKGAYTLNVTEHTVVAKAASKEGIFNAIQSIRQLLPHAIESKALVKNVSWTLPVVLIKDHPQYQWRGYMQDVSRTFYGVEVIKKYLDIMALYKMNVLHFHLTDDQGWRIEIRKYPELTSKKTTVFGESSKQPAERSGYYTQAQMMDLIAYAKARNISIVPEIDVPGHCWPIIITHPELGVNSKTQPDYVISFMDSYNYWGAQFTPNPLDPTKEAVYTFLGNVFSEIADLFPSKYIHFGGDEVVHRLWENEPHVQQFMKEKGMKKIEELQSYFVKRISAIVASKGKQPIGWNDILEDAANLPKNTAIMSWIGAGAVKDAAKYGFYTVACPTGPLYFDISQKDRNDGTMADLNYGGANTLEKVYNYNPLATLNETERKYVLGIQANMWPAVPQEVKDMNVQNFPRLLALSEIAWTSGQEKDLPEFLNRVSVNYGRLDTLKMDYYKAGGYITSSWTPAQISTEFKTLTFDVTPKIYTNGRVQAGFLFTSGQSYLKVKNVKLLENGIEISADAHESLADKYRGTPFKKNMYFYLLSVDKYKPKARYTLSAEVAGDKNNDSNGNVTVNLSPYKPFSVAEIKKE